MNVETSETDKGTRITIETDREVALIVESESKERIYLPNNSVSQSSYYVESTDSLIETEKGYAVMHPGKIDDLLVLG